MREKDFIGFAGVGNMGAPMVTNLRKAGHRVRIFDIRPEALAPFRGTDGIEIAGSPAGLGDGLSVVITMLADGKVVQKALLGEGGIAGGMARGGLVIDMSSSFPLDTRALSERLGPLGLTVMDAPVSGGVPRAVAGTLAIMAGGNAADVDRAMPILVAMGSVHRTGPLGSGHAMKALNNYLSAVGLIAASEALVVGQRFGLDPHVMTAVLNASTGKNNATENKIERYLLNGAFNSGFTLALLEKDVGMACRLAEDLGIPMQTLAATKDLLTRATAALGQAADHTAVYKYVADRAGGAG